MLKVPASVAVATREAVRTDRPASAEAPTKVQATARAGAGNGAQRTPPSQRGDAIAEQTAKLQAVRTPARSPVPRAARTVIWILAVPLGLVLVLVVGRFVGLLTIDRAVDVFVGVGWGRFVPPLLMLPVWAAATATVAHLLIEGIARWRR